MAPVMRPSKALCPPSEQMTLDPYKYFPYRFGHALWSYIASVGATRPWSDPQVYRCTGGLTVPFAHHRPHARTALQPWRDAVQKKYPIPETVPGQGAGRGLRPADRKELDGTLHLAPALSPDGSQVAYFSENDSTFVDLTGRRDHRQGEAAYPEVGCQQ